MLNIDSDKFKEDTNRLIENYDCIVIDNYTGNINESHLYSTLNHVSQLNKCIIINSKIELKQLDIKLNDLKSRLDSFLNIQILLPTDELLRVIIAKTFSDKQIKLTNRNLEFIIKNIERSYEKISKFIKDIDNLSLSTGKSININLIKKVLKNE